MRRKVQELYRDAAELPERDRAELAGMLIESLDGRPDEGVEAAWSEEVERRIREIDDGGVKTIPWEQVRAELSAASSMKIRFSSCCSTRAAYQKWYLERSESAAAGFEQEIDQAISRIAEALSATRSRARTDADSSC